MIICPHCKAQLPDWAKFCTECGSALPANDGAESDPRLIIRCDGAAECYYGPESLKLTFNEDRTFSLRQPYFDGRLRFRDSTAPAPASSSALNSLRKAMNIDGKKESGSTATDFGGIRSAVFAGCAGFVSHGPVRWCECHHLQVFDIGDLDTCRWTQFDNMFRDCWSVKKLDLSRMRVDSSTTTARMFAGCRSLEILNLSSWNLDNCLDADGMFEGCTALHTVDAGGQSLYTTGLIDRELRKAGIVPHLIV